MKKRLLAFLLVLVMVAGFVPVTALAEGESPAVVAQGTCGDQTATFTVTVKEAETWPQTGSISAGIWSLSEDGILSIEKGESDGNLNNATTGVQFSADNRPEWEPYKDRIVSVNIGEGITSLSQYAFLNHTALKTATFSDGFTTFGIYLFSGCTELETLSVPNTISSFPLTVFGSSREGAPETIYFSGTEEEWTSFITKNHPVIRNLLKTVEVFFTGSVVPDTVLGEGTCTDTISWKLTSDGVLTISGEGALPAYIPGASPWFSLRNDILSIVVEEGITALGDRDFYAHLNLESVSLPSTLTSIGMMCFDSDSKLTSVTVPEGVISLGNQAFGNCSALTAVDLPASLTALNTTVFSNDNGITSVGYGGSEVGWVTLGARVPQFQNAQVTCRGGKAVSIAISGQKTELSLYEHISLDGAVITVALDNGETSEIAAEYVTIGEPDTSTPGEKTVTVSFNDASVQYTVTVSDQIGEVGSGFCGAEGNEENVTWRLTSDGKMEISGTGAMADFASVSTQPWYAGHSYISEMVIGEGVTSIGDRAFSSCTNLTAVSIPNTVTSIGFSSF